MDYPKLTATLEKYGIDGALVQEILDAYADDVESGEPHAVSTIEQAREIGMDIAEIAEQ